MTYSERSTGAHITKDRLLVKKDTSWNILWRTEHKFLEKGNAGLQKMISGDSRKNYSLKTSSRYIAARYILNKKFCKKDHSLLSGLAFHTSRESFCIVRILHLPVLTFRPGKIKTNVGCHNRERVVFCSKEQTEMFGFTVLVLGRLSPLTPTKTNALREKNIKNFWVNNLPFCQNFQPFTKWYDAMYCSWRMLNGMVSKVF